MTDIEYTTLDSTSFSDIREGDRVTLTNEGWAGPHPVTSIVEDLTPGIDFTLGGWSHDTGVTIHKIERPVLRVVEEAGVVYGSPTDPTARVMCVATPARGGTTWIATAAAGGEAWLTTEHVQKLVSHCGYVRVDEHPEGGEHSRTPSLEDLRREFEFRIRTAVAFGIGRGKPDDHMTREQRADWVEAEINSAVDSITAIQAGGGKT